MARLLGQLDGVVEGQHRHGGTQPYPAGNPGQVGQHRQGGRNDAVSGEVVLGKPNRVEPQLLGPQHLVQGFLVVTLLAVGVRELHRVEKTKVHSDAHSEDLIRLGKPARRAGGPGTQA